MSFRWPWSRQRVVDTERTEVLGGAAEVLTAQYETPGITQIGLVRAACQTYATALTLAAPATGPLDPRVLADCGCRLGTRGRWSGLIEVDGAGDIVLTPFDAWPDNGVWVGSTREWAGRTPRMVSAPDAAVFHVALPQGAPLGALSSTASILHELERSVADDASTPTVPTLVQDIAYMNSSVSTRNELAKSWEDAFRGPTRIKVLPAGIQLEKGIRPGMEKTAIELREQLRHEVEALFGLQGLLGTTDATALQAQWRVAAVRTFAPMAIMIEREAATKLDRPYLLNREAWIAAPHSELARAANQRAAAYQRLRAAGMDDAPARAAAGV